MKKYFVLLTVVLAMVSTPVMGQGYFGFGGHVGTYDEGWVEVDTYGMTIKGGGYLIPNVALEARYLYGWGDWNDVDLEGSVISVFLKGDLPITEKSWIYGLLGFSHLWMEASAYGRSEDFDDDSPSFGAGIEVQPGIHKDIRIGIEYVWYGENDWYDYTGFNMWISAMF